LATDKREAEPKLARHKQATSSHHHLQKESSMNVQKPLTLIAALFVSAGFAACGGKTEDAAKSAAGAAASAAAGAAAGAAGAAAGAAVSEGEDPARTMKAIDPDGDGYVSADEMEKWLAANPGPFKKK
jgi:hypothetical protein